MTSPGTTREAGISVHAPSRSTRALISSRLRSSSTAASARLSWIIPSAVFRLRTARMMVASSHLASANSRTIVASSIQGTGAQSFLRMRFASPVFLRGTALGPTVSKSRVACSDVSP